MCNHIHPKNKQDKTEFVFTTKKGEFGVSLNKDFYKGEEFGYSYVTNASNEKLLYSYGFYVEDNNFSNTVVSIKLFKPQLTREKHNIIMHLKLVDMPFDGFFNTNHNSMTLIQVLDKNFLSKNVLGVLRIYHLDNKNYDYSIIEKRLQSNQLLSYENEVTALTELRSNIINDHIAKAKIKLEDIIQSLLISKDYYNKITDTLVDGNDEDNNKIFKDLGLSQTEFEAKYQLRNKIFEVLRESVTILYKNIIYTNDSLQDLMSDQIVKLKDYYLNDNNVANN